MEKIIERTQLPPVVFALLGLALIFIAYLLAGGQDRLMPMYGFPEPTYGCSFDDIGEMTSEPGPELSRAYSDSELLWCYPPQYFPLYVFAILGAILYGWSLIIGGKGIFRHERRSTENFLDGMVAFLVCLLTIVTGVRVFKLELDFIGGSVDRPPDVFNSLAVLLIIIGLLVLIFGVVAVIMAVIKAVKYRFG